MLFDSDWGGRKTELGPLSSKREEDVATRGVFSSTKDQVSYIV